MRGQRQTRAETRLVEWRWWRTNDDKVRPMPLPNNQQQVWQDGMRAMGTAMHYQCYQRT